MKIVFGLAALWLAGTSTVAWAQVSDAAGQEAQEPTKAGGQGGGLEDIVVTATRRSERLQDIPVTVTALTSASIASSGITDIRALTQAVPGFFGGKNLGLFLPVIRGVGSSSVSAADEANVATYIDGVYQPDPFSTYVDLAEVERVEVLRGPQGTVFGRNATGGLINVITPDPEFNLRGNVNARYGRLRNDSNDVDLRGYVTGGLSDTIAMDFSGVYRKTEDFIKDLVRGGKLGGIEVVNARSKILFKPSDASQIILMGEITDQNSSTNALQPIDGNTTGRRFAGVILPTGPWQAAVDVAPVLNFRRYNAALRTKFELGAVNLETTTGYMHNRTVQITDSDSSNIRIGSVQADNPNITSESISQEIRLLSAGSGPLKWLVGAYAFHLDASAGIRAISSPGGDAGPQTITRFNPELATTSFAGFGEGTYNLTDALFWTVGVRYTWEERKFRQILNGNDLFGEASKSFEKVTYRTALRYNFADNANIYASFGTGYKSGVFNYVGTARTPVNPETIKAWEVGVKADPLHWLRTNVSAYYYDYKNLQALARDATGTGFILQNAATAEIYGAELELTAAATDDLNIRTALAYNHADYKRFTGAQTFVPLAIGGNSTVSADASGNNMTRAPRFTMNVGFDWGTEVGSGRLSVAGNVYHSSRVYFDFANRFSQKSYELVSGEIAWTAGDTGLKLSIWTTNLTNAKVFREIRSSGAGTDATYEQPRRVGVGVGYRF